MDPVTTAIISALAGGIAKGATDVVKNAITDGYQGLKSLLKKKFGDSSEIANAVESLEKNPDSKARQDLVAEEALNAKAATDPDVLATANALLEMIEEMSGGKKLMGKTQNAMGNNIAQAQENSTATVNNYRPSD